MNVREIFGQTNLFVQDEKLIRLNVKTILKVKIK